MYRNIIVPMLAGFSIGFFAFSPDGQKMARELGKNILPILTGNGNNGGQSKDSIEAGKAIKTTEE